MTSAGDVREPEKVVFIDAELPVRQALSHTRRTFRSSRTSTWTPATPGKDLNWLEDVELLEEEGTPAVFDRYSNSFLRIYFPIPKGREDADRPQGADWPT